MQRRRGDRRSQYRKKLQKQQELQEQKEGQTLPAGEKKSTLRQDLMFLMLKILTIAVMFILVFTFLFGIGRSVDISMSPSIKDGDLVIFDRLDKKYIKSDVLVLKFQGEVQTRRVIAVAGDEVDITEDGLVINGSPQQEKDIKGKTFRYDTGVKFPLKVGEGEVFVLGDNRENSTDSRVYGSVKVKDTLGKVMTIIRRRGI